MDIKQAPLLEYARNLRTKKIDVTKYIDQLKNDFASIETEISAFVPENDRWGRLESELRALEERYPTVESRPPLYAVPVGVKDIYHAEKFETRAGSELPPRELTGSEARTVKKLKNAGALVLGKTVTAEFAHFEPGPTRNPHNLNYTPGGSSSGSAAAVAAGLCPLALGSQTIGSINRPAAFCGTVGVKPTYDRISNSGIFPVAPSVDTPGYFTQDVAGAQLAAGVLYADWRANDKPDPNFTIGAIEGSYIEQSSEEAQRHYKKQIETLKQSSLEVKDLQLFGDISKINQKHKSIVAAEMAISHNALYPKYEHIYASETINLIEKGQKVVIKELAEAKAGRKQLREKVHRKMDELDINILISPSAPGPAPEGIETTGDPIMNLPWSYSGLPTVTLPVSKNDQNLPMGIQCTGRYGHDEWLLYWCQEIHLELNEQESKQ